MPLSASSRFSKILLTTAITALYATSVTAAEKLYSPYIEKGEWELEYFGSRTNDNDSAKNNSQKNQISVAYGVNDWWKTELYAKWEKEPQEKTIFDAWEWENFFQFTERGEYWLDVGASLAYEYTPESDRLDTIEGRLLLAKDIGKTSHILNVILEKDVGSGGPRPGLEGGLLWSSRYNLNPYFEPGFEISSSFGELKHTGNFDNQEHYIGPVTYGHIPLHMANESDALKYRLGYMFGISDAASDGDVVAQLEYELPF